MHQFRNRDLISKLQIVNRKSLGVIELSISTDLGDTWATTLCIHVGEEISRPVLFAATGRESLPEILQL